MCSIEGVGEISPQPISINESEPTTMSTTDTQNAATIDIKALTPEQLAEAMQQMTPAEAKRFAKALEQVPAPSTKAVVAAAPAVSLAPKPVKRPRLLKPTNSFRATHRLARLITREATNVALCVGAAGAGVVSGAVMGPVDNATPAIIAAKQWLAEKAAEMDAEEEA